MTGQPYVDRWRLALRRQVVPALPDRVGPMDDGRHRPAGTCLLVLRTAAEFADYRTGLVVVTVEQLADACRISRRVCRAVLAWADAAGLCLQLRAHGRGRATRRLLVAPGLVVEVDELRAAGLTLDELHRALSRAAAPAASDPMNVPAHGGADQAPAAAADERPRLRRPINAADERPRRDDESPRAVDESSRSVDERPRHGGAAFTSPLETTTTTPSAASQLDGRDLRFLDHGGAQSTPRVDLSPPLPPHPPKNGPAEPARPPLGPASPACLKAAENAPETPRTTQQEPEQVTRSERSPAASSREAARAVLAGGVPAEHRAAAWPAVAQLERAVPAALAATGRPLDQLVAHVRTSWRPPTTSAAALVVFLVRQFGDAGPVDALDDAGPAAPARPAHCGECDERTRLLDRDGDHPHRCPACHPLAGLPVGIGA